MPFKPADIQGDVPAAAHLAVYTDNSGNVLAIPSGARMLLIEDPQRMDRIFPLILKRVNRKSIVFQCGCGKCTREYVYKLTDMKGLHAPTTSERHARALASAKRES